jgi:hypothetical protein
MLETELSLVQTCSQIDLALRFGLLRSAEYRIELLIRHIRLGDVSDMAPCTLCRGRLSSGLLIRQGVMAEGEVAPPIRPSKTFAVFYRDIHAVEVALKAGSSAS